MNVGDLIGTLMVVTRLGREMNSAVVASIGRGRWLTIAAEDFRETNPTRFAQRATRLRRFRGFCREYYGQLAFSEDEMAAALRTLDA